ncbi:MAG: hypothetical protein ACRDTD_27205, partial [Pseudonocardiaceae bacterium]
GEDDPQVSRQHGLLTHHRGQWRVNNTGRLPLRLPGARKLFSDEEPVPLPEGYTPLFVQGARGREHLLELYVIGPDGQRPASRHNDHTQLPRVWRLQKDERLALIVLGQQYLLYDAHPHPLSWRQAADQLAELQHDAGWTAKRVEHMIVLVRTRLSQGGRRSYSRGGRRADRQYPEPQPLDRTRAVNHPRPTGSSHPRRPSGDVNRHEPPTSWDWLETPCATR